MAIGWRVRRRSTSHSEAAHCLPYGATAGRWRGGGRGSPGSLQRWRRVDQPAGASGVLDGLYVALPDELADTFGVVAEATGDLLDSEPLDGIGVGGGMDLVWGRSKGRSA